MVDKYSWVDIGSSYLPSEIQAAYLWGQLEWADQITQNRLSTWNHYYEELSELAQTGRIELPVIPADCQHNGHMFYLKTKDLEERTDLLAHLKSDDIYAVFHYVPLHSAPAGLRFSRFHGDDIFTTKESERLVRLPIWYGMNEATRAHIVKSLSRFYA
jgi:dTDP-4-amino-4,6-dideoxygalactose transaminase